MVSNLLTHICKSHEYNNDYNLGWPICHIIFLVTLCEYKHNKYLQWSYIIWENTNNWENNPFHLRIILLNLISRAVLQWAHAHNQFPPLSPEPIPHQFPHQFPPQSPKPITHQFPPHRLISWASYGQGPSFLHLFQHPPEVICTKAREKSLLFRICSLSFWFNFKLIMKLRHMFN